MYAGDCTPFASRLASSFSAAHVVIVVGTGTKIFVATQDANGKAALSMAQVWTEDLPSNGQYATPEVSGNARRLRAWAPESIHLCRPFRRRMCHQAKHPGDATPSQAVRQPSPTL